MQRDARAWLSDILTACDLLAEFTKGKTFDDYAADALLRSASNVNSRSSVRLSASPYGINPSSRPVHRSSCYQACDTGGVPVLVTAAARRGI